MSEEKDIYIGQDGLEYCLKCKTARELRLPNKFMGDDYKVHVMCVCQKAEYEKSELERKEREFNEMVLANKSICFHEPRMREWTFENDDGSVPAMEKAKQLVESWDEVVREHAGLLLIYNTAQGKCVLCGRKITYDKMTLDHIVPLAMNGTDDVGNLQCTCEACNLFKGSVLPDDFMERITRIFLYQMDKKEG